ncbi:MAG: TolC family protein [Desulfobacteraceae bacterium]|nr:TolC family protein [Desulfobacteraceae bacterium]
MNNKLYLLVGIVILSLLSVNLYAGTVYSLYDLCKIADKNARAIKIAEDDLYISEQEKKRALAVLMPRLTAFGSKNRAFTEYENQVPDRKMNSIKDTKTFGLQLDQSFTLNGKELVALNATKDQIKKSEYDLESTKSNYLFEVATIYYQILSAKKNLDISKADVKRLEKHKNSVNEKLKVGTVTKTALFRAEAEHSKSKTNLLIAQNNFKLAKASLKNLVDIDEDFSLIEDQFFYLKGFELSYENLIKEAIENRPELKSITKTQEIAEKTIRYERGSYWPTVSVKGTYGDSEIISDHDSRFKFFDSETNVIEKSVEASLSFTIFDGGLRKAQINQAIAKKRQADAALIDTKNRIILESKKAWFDFETAQSAIETLKDELKSAKENFNAVSMQFEYGLSDSVDMMDADTLFVSAQRRLAEAEFSYELSILDIIRIKGKLLELLL